MKAYVIFFVNAGSFLKLNKSLIKRKSAMHFRSYLTIKINLKSLLKWCYYYKYIGI